MALRRAVPRLLAAPLLSLQPPMPLSRAAATAAAPSEAARTTHGRSSQQPVYVLFGATGGIGSAVARRLAASSGEGSALILSAHHRGPLEALAADLKGHMQLETAPADALDLKEVDAVVSGALQRHGRVDGVACCVGTVEASSLLATSGSDMDRVLRDNAVTAFNVLKAAIKAMVSAEGSGPQPGGSVVLVSAALASRGIPNYTAMSAAKGAVEGLMRSAAATYAPRGLRINCVAPGLVDSTRQTARFTDNEEVKGVSEEMHPAKHLVSTEDVAAAVAFLLDPQHSRSITGQTLAVDGGLTTLHPHNVAEYGV